MTRRRAVTLIELLLVIGIIGVLIGLLVPALRGARASAGATGSLANLSGIGKSLEVYAQANRMRYPYPPVDRGRQSSTGDGPMFGPLHATSRPGPDDSQLFFAPLFRMEWYWPLVLLEVAPLEEHIQTWLSPGHEAAGDTERILNRFPPRVSYRYSNSFVAKPRVWSGAPNITWDDIGPQMVTNVAHPSAKVVMYDADRSYLAMDPTPTDPRPLLFVDGSASLRLDSDARAPVENPLNNSRSRYHDTANGVLGVDF